MRRWFLTRKLSHRVKITFINFDQSEKTFPNPQIFRSNDSPSPTPRARSRAHDVHSSLSFWTRSSNSRFHERSFLESSRTLLDSSQIAQAPCKNAFREDSSFSVLFNKMKLETTISYWLFKVNCIFAGLFV